MSSKCFIGRVLIKFSLAPVKSKFEKVQKAFVEREDSLQISARTAKLIADISSGKLKTTDALAKAIALYLRRQNHLYGDEAFKKSINEVLAFISETGDFETLINAYGSNNDKDSRAPDDPEIIISIYQDMGPYGLMQLIEKQSNIVSRSRKASKLLEFGKILNKRLEITGLHTQLAKIVLALDKSEATYHEACLCMIDDGYFEEGLELFAYLYFYHKGYADHDVSQLAGLDKVFTEHFSREYVNEYLISSEEHCLQQIKENLIRNYRRRLILTDKNSQEKLFIEMLEKLNIEDIIQFINVDYRLNNKAKAALALRAIKAARSKLDTNRTYAIYIEKLADYAYSKDTSEGTLRNIYFSYQSVNAHKKSSKILELLKYFAGDAPTQRQRNLLWSAPDQLIKLADQVPKRVKAPLYQPIKGRICYVIHNSLPYSSGGYATRGHGLLTALKEQDLDIYAVTRPGYPHDISQIQVKDIAPKNIIDQVTYTRLLSPSRRDYSNYEYMLKAVESYKGVFTKDKPQLIIAASNHLDGLPAMFAARELGIPFIYEIRGFWEVTRLSKYPEFEHNPMFAVEKKLEALVAEHADHIFTLTQGMIDELESRGVDTREKITLLPNSCNVERFNTTSRDLLLTQELEIPPDIAVIGYVGTLVSYEGLDDLAIACSRLKQLGYEFRLLIVGNENATGQGKGSITDQVKNIAIEAGFEDWLIMPGRVPFEEVERYYSLIDIAPFPRKAWPVCEMVPPMKTLEALSMKKAVLVSSNKALTEMITHDVNGRIFERGDVEDLTKQMKYLLDNPEKWQAYGEAGRDFVERERTWKRTAERAKAVINNFIN